MKPVINAGDLVDKILDQGDELFTKENRGKSFIIESYICRTSNDSNGWWIEDEQISLRWKDNISLDLIDRLYEIYDKREFLKVKGRIRRVHAI